MSKLRDGYCDMSEGVYCIARTDIDKSPGLIGLRIERRVIDNTGGWVRYNRRLYRIHPANKLHDLLREQAKSGTWFFGLIASDAGDMPETVAPLPFFYSGRNLFHIEFS